MHAKKHLEGKVLPRTGRRERMRESMEKGARKGGFRTMLV